MTTSEIDDLRAELERLRTENDTLRTVPAETEVPPCTSADPRDGGGPSSRRSSS